jgi:hypothetical protein
MPKAVDFDNPDRESAAAIEAGITRPPGSQSAEASWTITLGVAKKA